MGICSSKFKPVSAAGKIKGKKISNSAKGLLEKLSKEEAIFLQLFFNDLVKKSTGEGIIKDVFLSVFSFPSKKGLLGERLFHYFDLKKSGFLDFDCFLQGIVRYCKGKTEEKQRIIFEICDFKEDLVLDCQELYILVSYKQRVLLGPEVLKQEESEKIRLNSMRTRRRSKTAVKPVNLPKDEVSIKEEIQKLLNNYGNGSHLKFTEFQQMLSFFPSITRIFDQVFSEKIWTSLEENSVPALRKSFTNSQISGEIYVKIEDSLSMRYGILKDNVLFLYQNINSKFPEQLIHMEGCYAETIGDFYITNKFGIQLTHQSADFGEVLLWTNTRKEREDWLRYLEIASSQRKFKEYYSIGEKIGQGKFSDVFVCTEHISYKKWAVKIVNKQKLSQLEKELLSSEIKILKILDHPNIIKIKEIFDSKKHILIVMELVEGGELFQLIKKKKVFSEYTTSKIIKQLLDALTYLHYLGILHRDIKPENILLIDGSDIPSIKLADFGLAKVSPPGEAQMLACGTLGYVAPEVLSQTGYNDKSDIWSVGVITYLLLRGRLPFDHKDKKVLIELTLEASYSFEEPYWRTFTSYALDFITKLINKDPGDRFGPAEALDHPWVKNSEILIPRAIDRRKMEDMFIGKGVSSTNFGKVQYREISVNVDTNSNSFEVRSMPNLFEDVEGDKKENITLIDNPVD